ncbi:MAG: hypothetical protein ACOC5T_06945 [Elusimicrobiota bacterium]
MSFQSEKNFDRETEESSETEEERGEAGVDFQALVENSLERICTENEEPENRVEELLGLLEPVSEKLNEEVLAQKDFEKMKEEIKSLTETSKEEFIEGSLEAMEPLFEARREYPHQFDDATAEAMNEAGDFTEINRLLSYGRYKNEIHIHAPHGETVPNKLKLYREGMRELAEIVKKDPEVEKVTATSYLVAQHPGLFERMGFEVEELPESQKIQGTLEEKKATISREDFLEKFKD